MATVRTPTALTTLLGCCGLCTHTVNCVPHRWLGAATSRQHLRMPWLICCWQNSCSQAVQAQPLLCLQSTRGNTAIDCKQTCTPCRLEVLQFVSSSVGYPPPPPNSNRSSSSAVHSQVACHLCAPRCIERPLPPSSAHYTADSRSRLVAQRVHPRCQCSRNLPLQCCQVAGCARHGLARCC